MHTSMGEKGRVGKGEGERGLVIITDGLNINSGPLTI